MGPPCHCEECSDEVIPVGTIEIATPQHVGARNDKKAAADDTRFSIVKERIPSPLE